MLLNLCNPQMWNIDHPKERSVMQLFEYPIFEKCRSFSLFSAYLLSHFGFCGEIPANCILIICNNNSIAHNWIKTWHIASAFNCDFVIKYIITCGGIQFFLFGLRSNFYLDAATAAFAIFGVMSIICIYMHVKIHGVYYSICILIFRRYYSSGKLKFP